MNKEEIKTKCESKARRSITFGGLGGWLLTLGIVLVRGLQPNATPIADWSVKSWILMTMPIWLPIAIGLVLFVVWFIVWVWADSRKF